MSLCLNLVATTLRLEFCALPFNLLAPEPIVDLVELVKVVSPTDDERLAFPGFSEAKAWASLVVPPEIGPVVRRLESSVCALVQLREESGERSYDEGGLGYPKPARL